MKKISRYMLILMLVCSGLFFSQAAFSETASPADDAIIPKLLAGQEKLFERDYDAALKIFRELQVEYPESSGGYFGEMAIYEMKMIEKEDLSYKVEMQKVANEGRNRIEKLMQKYKPSPWALFLSGSELGLEGLFKARKGDWWDAYVLGNESRQVYKHVKEIDPSFVDADFGLGMYLYWRSVFIKDLWFLKMIPDKRAEGLAIVENVAKNGKYAKNLADVSLAIAYLEEKRFNDSAAILNAYVTKYPKNVIFRRIYGKALVAMHQYDEAVKQFRAILTVDPEFKKPYYFVGATLVMKGDPKDYDQAEKELRHFIKIQEGKYWPASAHYWLGRLYEKKGDKAASVAEYEVAYKLDPKIDDALKRARALGSGL